MSGILNPCRSEAGARWLLLLLALLSSVAPSGVLGADGAENPMPGWIPAPIGYPPPGSGYVPRVGPQYPGAAPPVPAPPAPVQPAQQLPVGAAPAIEPPVSQSGPAAPPAPRAQTQLRAPTQEPGAHTVAAPPAAGSAGTGPAPVSAVSVAEPPASPTPPPASAQARAVAQAAPEGAYPDVTPDTADAADGAAAQVADAGADSASGLTSGDSPECMRCHWMETMAYRDRETREIVNLSIDRDAYEHSVHHELACRDCHDRGYKHYPHRTSSADENLQCVECHEDRQGDEHHQPPKLDAFAIQYQDSVHAKQDEEPFSCFSCHNPHRFRPLPNDTPVPQVVAANNNLCLDCHTELRSPVPKGHDWLPRPQQHWAAVRCIDCHTPVEGRDLYAPSHEMLGAEESNQNCVECHSQGGQLLAQLYVHRAEQEREQEGFLAHAIYNDAYIIGMSRSPLIDLIGLAIVGLMVIGIGAHGFGRYLAHKRQQEAQ
ncbi:cytochrome c3 family protein [uncultured Thiohalocapsa sp.]|uniref:cytochrome c3 family protein n=1 Tax=uncultured Thiohalocapsa sp. TaxID=768990 RepID=UPI0025FB6AB5|nr:cytochrome c3 family protein [uncultured Thiohalocapsa sp.]